MKQNMLGATITALVFAMVLGVSGIAFAHGHWGGGYNNTLSPEQQKAMQEMRAEFDSKIRPLQQQFYAKQAELDALYYKGTPQDNPKVQSLIKELSELDTRLYAAFGELHRQMSEKGLPWHNGMRRGYNCGPGRGYGQYQGHGGGCGYNGYHGRGPCYAW